MPLGRLDRPLSVRPVRERDVDRVDIFVGQDRLIRVVGVRAVAKRGELLGPREVTAANGRQGVVFGGLDGRDHSAFGDLSRAQDPPVKCRHVCLSLVAAAFRNPTV